MNSQGFPVNWVPITLSTVFWPAGYYGYFILSSLGLYPFWPTQHQYLKNFLIWNHPLPLFLWDNCGALQSLLLDAAHCMFVQRLICGCHVQTKPVVHKNSCWQPKAAKRQNSRSFLDRNFHHQVHVLNLMYHT